MKIPLDRQAKQPIYLQIRDRIQQLIHSGGLPSGAQLPSIRSLAQTVKVNKLTVLEAYSILEAEGLVQAKRGSGYFINPPELRVPAPQNPLPPASFNPTQEVVIPSSGGNSFPEIYYATLNSHSWPDTIDFSRGEPRPFGVEDLRRIARRAMKDSDLFFQRTHPKGDLSLRGQISQILIQQGLETNADNLIVTSGSMQALSLLAEHFISPGDWVVVEAPTYHGFLSVLQQRGAQIIGIPMTPEGINLALLAQYLQSHRPKIIYTISTLHNPTGITTSADHRRQLLALAEQFDCIIIEDNAYEPLSFEATPPPIKAFDTQDRVIYVGTFSKTLMLGLRVGYMAITGEQNKALTERKLLHDFHISNASQAIVKEYLSSGHYRRRLEKLKSLHRDRRDYMVSALIRHLPEGVTWTVPEGGTFLWIQLPDQLLVTDISTALAEQKVLAASGAAFFPNQQGYPALRLNFSLPPEETEKGIGILSDILRSHLNSNP